MTNRERWLMIGLVALWALLFLPNLRTSPNWYGDEGEWMEKCWQLANGQARIGPVSNDFVYPYPYPPLYMWVTGTALRLFGNDVVVGRAVGVLTALAAAGILFWIGRRLKDEWLGFFCAAALLVYENADVNFRWVRSHPMTGMFALASVGFLIRYLNDKRLRDLALAGMFTALATACNYYAVGMIPGVIAVAVWVNWKRWRELPAWRDVLVAGLTAGGFGLVFVGWYLMAHGGVPHLLAQVKLMGGMAQSPPVSEVITRIGRFCFNTPTAFTATGPTGRDWWLVLAVVGMAAFPVGRLRVWLVAWVVLLMWPIFRKQDNVSWFFYPAMIFLPVMALGVGGALEQAGRLAGKALKSSALPVRLAPGVVVLVLWCWPTFGKAWSHFDTLIDAFTQQSVADADAALAFVNANTTSEDFVLVPKQVYWLVKHARKSMLSHCDPYNGKTNGAWPAPVPREDYWFDCRWQAAKYAVLASGTSQRGQGIGIDLVYTRGAAGGQEAVAGMLAENWRVVFPPNAQVVYPQQLGGRWPVAVGTEYMVLGNPRLMK
jgi:Dolichyl-phosphate-mannose-protein mannosyltransferase